MFIKSSVAKIKKVDEKQVHETVGYPEIKKSENDIYIISVNGDRFDLLAHKYYNDPSLWWIIAKANNIYGGSFSITPGIQIRIPNDPDLVIQDYINFNA